MRRACIDIGSNTTRLLVADCEGGRLREVHQERVFTRISKGLGPGGEIAPSKIEEVTHAVSAQLAAAHELGANELLVVGTAAIRRAGNGGELTVAIKAACGLEVTILTGEQEARLAFLGAAGMLDHPPVGALGVVDVGGGSSEVVVGQAPDKISWSTSFAVGSGDLAEQFLHSDPPSRDQLSRARRRVVEILGNVEAPRPQAAVAVGGSATSLRRLVGERLDSVVFKRTLELLLSASTAAIARRYALDRERVRLLPAGLLILEAASEMFGAALEIGRGGIREGLLLEANA